MKRSNPNIKIPKICANNEIIILIDWYLNKKEFLEVWLLKRFI